MVGDTGRDLRVIYAETLVDLAKQYDDVVVVTADSSYRLPEFKKVFPERLINVGIAEQTMMGVAAGLATCGLVPYTSCLGFLPSMRACEQMRTDLCYPRLHVNVVASDCGVSMGTVGSTHHATEDLAITRSFPNITIISPGDGREFEQALRASYRWDGPIYIRMARGIMPAIYGPEYSFQIGRAVTLRGGDDVAIFATGSSVSRALNAAELLGAKGIRARVINIHTIKPLDSETILKAAKETGFIVTVEEHQVTGGLGGAISELVTLAVPVPVLRIGLPDTFCVIGPYEDLLKKYRLDSVSIAEAVHKFLGKGCEA